MTNSAESNEATQPVSAESVEVLVLNDLFNKAKSADEFEYVCALLRIRGIEDAGWDPLIESQRTINDYLALIQAPLRGDTQIRLALLVYCHILETDSVYEVIENMLSVTEGKRCSTSPLAHLYEKRRKKGFQPVRPPSAKKVVRYLMEHASRVGEPKLVNLLEDMFNEDIRNAFFHSDYTVYNDEFRVRHGKFNAIKITELGNVLNKALSFFQSFLHVWNLHRVSYKESKVVKGRFAPGEDIELLVKPGVGVYGFQVPPGQKTQAKRTSE